MSKPIFISGLPRSGTTWTASTLAQHPRMEYIHEPFNWKLHPKREKYHMHYMPMNMQDQTFSVIIKSLLLPGKKTSSTFQEKINSLFKAVCCIKLIKDVHTCLALEAIDAIIKPQIIIILRHPCGLAASWRKLGYRVDNRIKLLINQKQLVEDWLRPFIPHMTCSHDPFFLIGAYWGATYYILDQQAKFHPNWIVLRYEDLCAAPLFQFRTLCHRLGLNFTHQIESFIVSSSHAEKKETHPYSVFRDTEKEAEKWKKILNASEIKRIYKGATKFSILHKYYP